MNFIERDILLDPNESGDYWFIPVSFHLEEQASEVDAPWVNIESPSNYTVVLGAYTSYISNGTVEAQSVSTTEWVLIYYGYFVGVKVPKTSFTGQYLTVNVALEDTSGVSDPNEDDPEIVCKVILNLRKAPVSSGSGSSGGSSSSISVPTAPEIAAAVWNYGADDGDETVTDRTLSTTVEVNPSAIAQAVWNYSVAEPASGTLGTRTLTTSIPTAANIATAVLTTDVSDEPVETDEYTLKHLVMASQRSKVVTENGETVWKIMGNRLSGETGEEIVIATRTLTLNANGAITETN